jgi:hypothetical protein
MSIVLPFVPLAALFLTDPGPAAEAWEEKASDDGITVFNRGHPGSPVRELKATGLVDAPPKAAWAVVRDYDHYKDNMPYTEESRVLSRDDTGKEILFYSVINAPLVSRRDYVIRVLDESDWKDGAGFLKATWSVTDKMNPPVRDGVIRLKQSDGFWMFEPREGGKKTFATYWLFTDPGGSIPTWLVNKANSTTVPDVFKAIRKKALQSPYRDTK